MPTSRGKVRWWDLFFIALNAYLGLFIVCFVCVLAGSILYLAMGYGTDVDAFITASFTNFFFTQIFEAGFCLALLLATRRMVRKRRGRGSFAGYFRPIGGRRLLYAALSGCGAAGVVVLVIAVLWSPVHWHYHRKAAEVYRTTAFAWTTGNLGIDRCRARSNQRRDVFPWALAGMVSAETGPLARSLNYRNYRRDLCPLAFSLSASPGDRRLDCLH